MFLEILSLGSLQIEPRVGKGFDMGEQGLDERMKLVLKTEKKYYDNRKTQCKVAGFLLL